MSAATHYANDIYAKVFSAMSYHSARSSPTPSTTGIAADLATVTHDDPLAVERSFRESWRYLRSGLVFFFVVYNDASSHGATSERLLFQHMLRHVIMSSLALSCDDVHIIPMGIPAEYTVQPVLTSMGSYRTRVKKHEYPNPAVFSRMPGVGDTSLNLKFGKPATSRVISGCIKRSAHFPELSEGDFEPNMDNTAREPTR